MYIIKDESGRYFSQYITNKEFQAFGMKKDAFCFKSYGDAKDNLKNMHGECRIIEVKA